MSVITVLFAACFVLTVIIGLFAISFLVETAVEKMLPEAWQPSAIATRKQKEQLLDAHTARVAAIREKIRQKSQVANPHMTQAEMFRERLAKAPAIEEGLSVAIGRAIEQRYEQEDLTDEISSLYEPTPVAPKRIQRVCICRFPLTEHSEYLGGFVREQPVWGPRRFAKIFLSNNGELTDALTRAGKNSPTEIFVLLADSTGELKQPKISKAASA